MNQLTPPLERFGIGQGMSDPGYGKLTSWPKNSALF
jgi:hypothetical protein